MANTKSFANYNMRLDGFVMSNTLANVTNVTEWEVYYLGVGSGA